MPPAFVRALLIFLARLFFFRRDSCFICVRGATFFIWCDSFFIWHDLFYLARLVIWQLHLRLRPNSSYQIISVVIVIVGNLINKKLRRQLQLKRHIKIGLCGS